MTITLVLLVNFFILISSHLIYSRIEMNLTKKLMNFSNIQEMVLRAIIMASRIIERELNLVLIYILDVNNQDCCIRWIFIWCFCPSFQCPSFLVGVHQPDIDGMQFGYIAPFFTSKWMEMRCGIAAGSLSNLKFLLCH